MTLAEYANALASAVTAAGERARAWHGTHEHRVYRGDDYVDVWEATDGTGGYGPIVGRDRRFSAALAAADRALGDVPIVSTAAVQPAPAKPITAFGAQFGRCASCGAPTRNGAHVLRTDSSGLQGWCCPRCAALSAAARSFA